MITSVQSHHNSSFLLNVRLSTLLSTLCPECFLLHIHCEQNESVFWKALFSFLAKHRPQHDAATLVLHSCDGVLWYEKTLSIADHYCQTVTFLFHLTMNIPPEGWWLLADWFSLESGLHADYQPKWCEISQWLLHLFLCITCIWSSMYIVYDVFKCAGSKNKSSAIINYDDWGLFSLSQVLTYTFLNFSSIAL